MNFDIIGNVAGAIVGLAIAVTIFTSPNTAAIIRSVGNTFSDGIRAAQGR